MRRFDRIVGSNLLALHQRLYEVSGGRFGHHFRRVRMLLLRTRGRKSGQRRTAALLYHLDGDQFVVVGSKGGSDTPPAHVKDAPASVAQDELIDTERLLPGASGVIDARAFLTVLDEIGFDGPTLVEPFNAEVRALPPDERVAAVAASLQSVWP
jgi:hypothetical protein